MEQDSENLKERLRSHLPRPDESANYRLQVAALLEKNEKNLRRQQWYSAAIWIMVVAIGTVFLIAAGMQADKPKAAFLAAWLGSFACFLLIYAAAEMMKYFVNRVRVELLKETKQLQLQVLELRSLLRKEGA